MSERRYRLASSTGEVWDWNIETNEIARQPEFWRRLGYAPVDGHDQMAFFESVLHPEDLERWRSAVTEHITRRSPYDLEFRVRAKSGEYRWFHTRGQGTWDESGRATYMAGTSFEITDRKRAEASLRLSEERFNHAFHVSPAGLTITRIADGKLIEVNETFLRMFEFSREEAIGHTTIELQMLTPQQRSEMIERQIETGGVRDFELQAQVKSGRVIDLLASSQPIEIRGEPHHVTHLIDITERKRVAEELRRANERQRVLSSRLLEVQEQERAAIARELHDEIGQSLTAIKLGMQGLARKLSRADAKKLAESVALVDHTLSQTRNLALDLRPPQLDHLGLAATLRDHLENAAALAGYQPAFSSDQEYLALDKQLATAAFRVAQEALTNAARHAGARNVAVELRTQGGELMLAVSDDGRGYDLEEARRRALKGGSMGILGMEERVALAGGRLSIVTRPGEGTRVQAAFPLVPPAPADEHGA